MRKGFITGPAILGALWMVVIATTVAVTMSFATGAAFRPQVLLSLIWGAVAGLAMSAFRPAWRPARLGVSALLGLSCLTGFGPVLIGSDTTLQATARLLDRRRRDACVHGRDPEGSCLSASSPATNTKTR